MNGRSWLGSRGTWVASLNDPASSGSWPVLLCNILGHDVKRGLVPDDRQLLGRMVQDIAFFNARANLGLELGRLGQGVEPAAA